MDDTTPWKLDIDNPLEKEKLQEVLFHLISDLRQVAIMLLPFFDAKMRELLTRVGVPYDDSISLEENMRVTPESYLVGEKGDPLYTRILIQK